LTDYGEWNDVVRGLANYDPTRYAEVLRFPLTEALNCYEQQLRGDARRDHEYMVLIWAVLNSHGMGKKSKPPNLPAILEG
jgi:hypothetical protein